MAVAFENDGKRLGCFLPYIRQQFVNWLGYIVQMVVEQAAFIRGTRLDPIGRRPDVWLQFVLRESNR